MHWNYLHLKGREGKNKFLLALGSILTNFVPQFNIVFIGSGYLWASPAYKLKTVELLKSNHFSRSSQQASPTAVPGFATQWIFIFKPGGGGGGGGGGKEGCLVMALFYRLNSQIMEAISFTHNNNFYNLKEIRSELDLFRSVQLDRIWNPDPS